MDPNDPLSTPSPEGAPKPPRHRRPYKIRGPETWAVIRESYLAGASARVVAERYDVTEQAIRKRALREGWTKNSRPEGEPPPALKPPPPLFGPGSDQPRRPPDSVDYAALQIEAGDASARAMRQGRVDEALAWARLADNYGRIIETNQRVYSKSPAGTCCRCRQLSSPAQRGRGTAKRWRGRTRPARQPEVRRWPPPPPFGWSPSPVNRGGERR